MSAERFGPWQEISICTKCGGLIEKEHGWMDPFFVECCPRCGEYNGGYFGIFRGVTARPVRTRWGRFLRWEFKDPERVEAIRQKAET